MKQFRKTLLVLDPVAQQQPVFGMAAQCAGQEKLRAWMSICIESSVVMRMLLHEQAYWADSLPRLPWKVDDSRI